jgi:tRNA-dihydrouridine synthase
VKRVGEGRWGEVKERLFFDELAATANVKRAAEAAGVSTNAVYARRMKHALFRAKWEAVLETGRAAIEMKLVEAANRSFDPEEIELGSMEPRVSVAEAIRIVQLHGSKAQRHSIEEIEPPADEIEAIRERLLDRLERLRKREAEQAGDAGDC